MSEPVLELSVASVSNMASETVLTAPANFKWEVKGSKIGGCELELLYSDPQLSLVSATDKVIKVKLDDEPVAAYVLEIDDDDLIDSGGPANANRVRNGREHTSLLDRIAVRPALGYRKKPWSKNRTFNFSNPEYVPVGGWGAPTVIVSELRFRAPAGAISLGDPWIASSLGDAFSAPMGYIYGIHNHTFAEDTLVLFDMAADDAVKFWFNGQLIADIDPTTDPTSGYASSTQVTMWVTAGTYRLGWKLINNFGMGDPGFGEGTTYSGNQTAVYYSCWEWETSGQLIGRLFGSGDVDDIQILPYPDNPPGMSIQQITRIIVEEMQDEGVLPWLTLDFDDEDGPIAAESVTVRIGSSLQSNLDDWDGIYCEWDMNPDSLELQMWNLDERGASSGVTYSATQIASTSSIVDLSRRKLRINTEALIVEFADGQFRYPETGGTSITGLELPSSSYHEALQIAQLVLALQGEPEQIEVEIYPVGDGDVPGVDWRIADTFDLVIPGTTFTEKVVEWSGQLVVGGVNFGVKVKDRHPSRAESVDRVLRHWAPGSLGGTSISSPAGEAPKFGTQASTSEITFDVPDDVDLGVKSKDKHPKTGQNLFGVYASLTEAASSDTEFEVWITYDEGVTYEDILAGTGVLPSGETQVLLGLPPLSGDFYRTVWAPTFSGIGVEVNAFGTGGSGLLIETRAR